MTCTAKGTLQGGSHGSLVMFEPVATGNQGIRGAAAVGLRVSSITRAARPSRGSQHYIYIFVYILHKYVYINIYIYICIIYVDSSRWSLIPGLARKYLLEANSQCPNLVCLSVCLSVCVSVSVSLSFSVRVCFKFRVPGFGFKEFPPRTEEGVPSPGDGLRRRSRRWQSRGFPGGRAQTTRDPFGELRSFGGKTFEVNNSFVHEV